MIGRRTRNIVVPLLIAVLGWSTTSQAQEDGWSVRYEVDAPATGAMLVGAWAMSRIGVDTTRRWDSEWLACDQAIRGTSSATAASTSDVTLGLTLASPVVVDASTGLDADTGERGMIYGESIAATLLLTATTKYLVQRPRPYVYGENSNNEHASEEPDAHLSFFSGHASTSFTAAVAGSTLYAAQSDSDAASAALWGTELALASMTSTLRVRAGKHFPSDVVVGALIGTGVGVVVPRLHLEDSSYTPSTAQWAAMAGGVLVGTSAACLLPLDDDRRVQLPVDGALLLPMPVQHGTGVMVMGQL